MQVGALKISLESAYKELAETRRGSALAAWWCEGQVAEEGSVGGVKAGDDDTVADFYRRIAGEVSAARDRAKARKATWGVAEAVRAEVSEESLSRSTLRMSMRT